MRRGIILLIFLFIFSKYDGVIAQNYNTWEKLPLFGASINTGGIAFQRPDSLIIIASEHAFYSLNQSVDWHQIDQSMSLANQTFLPPEYPDSILVNNSIYFLYSGDFGKTWSQIRYPNSLLLDLSALSFSKTSILYGAKFGGEKLYKSEDRGKNWQVILTIPNGSIRKFDVSQQDYRIVYAGFRDSIYKSIDAGATWQNITHNYFSSGGQQFMSISVSPYDDQLVFAYPAYNTATMSVSYNGGASWQSVALPAYDSGINEMTFYPDDQRIYLGTNENGIFYSTDRGAHWSIMNDNGLLNKYVRKVLVNPKDSNVLYALTGGNGVFKSTDNGQNWLSFNQGIYGATIKQIAESPTNKDVILAGLENGGITRSINNGKNWSIVSLGLTDLDIKDLIWPTSTSTKIGALTYKKGFFLSENNGSSWQAAQNGATLNSYYSLAFDSVSGRLYESGKTTGPTQSPILYSDNWGQTWNELTVPSGFPTIVNDIAYNTLNSSLYAATSTELYRYDGISWVNLSGSFFTNEGRSPVQIALHPSTADTIYIAAGNYFIYMGTNGGTLWQSIYPYGGGQEILLDPHQPNIAYIIGNGRQKSYDGGKTWHFIESKEVLPWLNSIGGNISIHDNNTIYYKSRSGLYRMYQAGELSATTPSTVQAEIDSTTQLETTISNTGNAELDITSIHIEGAHKTHWKVQNLPSGSLSLIPYNNTKVHLQFQPDSVGALDAVLSGVTNDPLLQNMQIALRGIGLGPLLYLPVTTVNFENQYVSSNSDSAIIIANTGNETLQVNSAVISGNGASAYEIISGGAPFTIIAGQTHSLSLRFSPESDGSFPATLTLSSDDLNHAQQTVSLQGQGVIKPTGTIAVTSDSVLFGTVLVNESSDPKILTISNTSSTDTLRLDSLEITSTLFTYKLSSGLPIAIVPQQKETIELTFSPIESDTVTADLFIYSDASNNKVLRISLSGKGKVPQPPQISFNAGSISANSGSDAGISLSLSSDLPITYARLLYHEGGKTNWDSTALSNTSGTTYSAKIPKSLITIDGLAYYFRVSDGRHIVRYPTNGSLNLPVKITNKEQNIIGDGSYQMISIPMELDDASPLSVLGDNLGEYDIHKWRLFRWLDNAYVELNDKQKSIGTFTPGSAFWLATKSATSFNTGSGTSVSVADSIVLNLQKGWNQIANPYAFNISWASVDKKGSIANDLWQYSSDEKSFKQTQTLQPWQGYFVKALESNTRLIFHPLEGSAPQALMVKKADSPGWHIQIIARTKSAMDAENYVGMRADAADEYDNDDHFEPPAMGDFVSLYFSHPEWQNADKYSADIRSLNPDGAQWEFTVECPPNSGKVGLQFNLNDLNLKDKEIWLYDQKARIPIDIRTNPKYEFQRGEKKAGRTFRLIVGTSAYINDQFSDLQIYPNKLTLYPNFPNPFNPETIIKFALPKDSPVWLTVYDVLGHKVRTLSDGKILNKGFHSFLWRARNDHGERQASGLYFLLLHTRSQHRVMKMILVK